MHLDSSRRGGDTRLVNRGGGRGRLPEDELSEPERALKAALPSGETVDLRANAPGVSDDPADGAAWGPERTVGAELIRELLVAETPPGIPPPRALKLRGARIEGELDLERDSLRCPPTLQDCFFEQSLNFREARVPGLRLPGSRVPGLDAQQLDARGNLELSNIAAEGEIRLLGAKIAGELDLSGAHLANPEGPALNGDGMSVDGSVSCGEGFVAKGEVSLLSAKIAGKLDLSGARLANPEGSALSAAALSVEGGLFCGGLTAGGEVSLYAAKIAPALYISGAHLANLGGSALRADRMTVDGTMFCGDGFVAEGELSLPGAKIAGTLDLSGAKLANPKGQALFGDRMSIGEGLYSTRGPLVTEGEVRLFDARIGGEINLSGARLANPGGRAFSADGTSVEADVFLHAGFRAEGEVRLLATKIAGTLYLSSARLANPAGSALIAGRMSVAGSVRADGLCALGNVEMRGAKVGSQLILDGAGLANPEGPALSGDGISVEQGMSCGEGFVAEGEVSLRRARIDGPLILSGARLANSRGLALDLEGLVATEVTLTPGRRPEGVVDLTNVRVDRYRDDQATWPATLRLRGFAYDRLADSSGSDVDARLRWLDLNEGGYAPQIYDQLAGAYRRDGRDEAARDVLVAKQRRRRKELGRPGKAWNSLLHATVGYGYKPYYALIWLGVLLAIGAVVFHFAYPEHMVATTGTPPSFHDWVYALDTLLPIIDLGQQSNWNPEGAAQYVSYLLIAGGWVLSTALVAALTGLIKRD
jgi:hypothetical protein